jgi:hypothetical protein
MAVMLLAPMVQNVSETDRLAEIVQCGEPAQ